MNSDAIKSLSYDADALPEVSLDINTFAGVVSCNYKQISLDNEYRDIPIPILIDDELKIEFKIPQMQDVLKNIKPGNFSVVTDYPNSECFKLDGLVGMDIIEGINFSTIDVLRICS